MSVWFVFETTSLLCFVPGVFFPVLLFWSGQKRYTTLVGRVCFAFVVINFSSSKLLCATPRQASFRAGGGMQVGGERSLELAARSRLSV